MTSIGEPLWFCDTGLGNVIFCISYRDKLRVMGCNVTGCVLYRDKLRLTGYRFRKKSHSSPLTALRADLKSLLAILM